MKGSNEARCIRSRGRWLRRPRCVVAQQRSRILVWILANDRLTTWRFPVIRRITALALLLTLTAACHPGQFNSTPSHGFNQAARPPFSSNGDNTDFFGNPLAVDPPPGTDQDVVGNSAGCDVPKTEQEP